MRLIDKVRRSTMQPFSLAAAPLNLGAYDFTAYTMPLSSPVALPIYLFHPSILSGYGSAQRHSQHHRSSPGLG